MDGDRLKVHLNTKLLINFRTLKPCQVKGNFRRLEISQSNNIKMEMLWIHLRYESTIDERCFIFL